MKIKVGDPINVYLTKLLNIFRFLVYKIIDFILSLQRQENQPDTILLIRLDSIGDYVLIRNYFYFIKKSRIYQNYKVTLCGNEIWKDLAEAFDKSAIDDFLWLNRKKFNNNPFYKYRLLKKIYKSGFKVAIDTTFSREILFGDSIINTSRAKERIGSIGAPDSYVRWKRNLLTDRYYTKLVTQSAVNLFEFYRNKEFLESVLQEKISIFKPEIDTSTIDVQLPTKENFAVVFPGAQIEERRWQSKNYGQIIEELINRFNLKVIIAGSKSDSEIALKIVKEHLSNNCYDITGKTSLPQLAKLITLSKILISNETSAVHFAASVGTPFICISNGNHFGRFNPYPKAMITKSIYIYPDEIEENITNWEFLSEKYRYKSTLDINSINPKKVISAIKTIL